jgi:hypothetical protein
MNTELLLRVQRSDPAPPNEAIPHEVWDSKQVLDELQRRIDGGASSRPSPYRPWLIAAAAAAVVLVLVGGLGLLAQRSDRPADAPIVDQVEPETPPVIDPSATTLPPVVEPAEPDEATGETEGQGLLEDLPPDTEFGTLDTPIGQVEWVHLTGDGTTFPPRGDVIEWPTGFAVLERNSGGARLWVSADAIDWQLQPIPIPGDVWQASQASLTSVDGVYWLISSGPASIWSSTDGVSWDEYDLGDVIPGPVGLNWDMHHSSPVTVAGQTLIQAGFGSNFPIADYAPNLREDGRVCDHVRLAQLRSDLFQVVEDYGEGPDCPEQPVLRMIETETGLQIVDNDTGDELGMILGADLTDMAHVTEESWDEAILIVDEGGITSIDVPWQQGWVVAMFRGENAVYAYIDHSNHDTETQVAVWRTDDGRTWEEVTPLGFLETAGSIGSARFTELSDGRLVAWNRSVPNAAWETTDGLNWQSVDLPPLPADGDGQALPVPLDSGWFANAGWDLRNYGAGDRWWLKADDTWVTLTDLGIEEGGPEINATGIDATTFLRANEGRDMWILRLNPQP